MSKSWDTYMDYWRGLYPTPKSLEGFGPLRPLLWRTSAEMHFSRVQCSQRVPTPSVEQFMLSSLLQWMCACEGREKAAASSRTGYASNFQTINAWLSSVITHMLIAVCPLSRQPLRQFSLNRSALADTFYWRPQHATTRSQMPIQS